MSTSTSRPATAVAAGAFALDAALVIVFAIIGRASHERDLSVAGVAVTAWPFVVALAAGWLVTRAWRAPHRPVRTGLGVWAVTVVGGMLLRAVSGQGIAVAFVVVATLTLGLLLIGWRVIAWRVIAWRPRR